MDESSNQSGSGTDSQIPLVKKIKQEYLDEAASMGVTEFAYVKTENESMSEDDDNFEIGETIITTQSDCTTEPVDSQSINTKAGTSNGNNRKDIDNIQLDEEPSSNAITAPRRRLNITSDDDRQRVVSAYQEGSSPGAISRMLGINQATVYGIINTYKNSWRIAAKRRGGNKPKLLSQEALANIRRWMDEDCTISLKALAEKVFQTHGVRVSSRTVSRELKTCQLYYSFKLRRDIPERRNCLTTVERRKTFATILYESARKINENGLVFLGGIGFRINMRIPGGGFCHNTSSGVLRTKNMAVLCAINRTGFEMSSVRKKSSSMWQHFEKMENSGKCLYCAQVIRCTRGSSSNLKRHLAAKHAGILLSRVKHSSSNRESSRKSDEECSSVQRSSAVTSQPATMDTFFSPVQPMADDAKRKQDERLFKLICEEGLPYSITESEAFKNYSYGLNPNYHIPSRKTVSQAIHREFNKSIQKVKNALENSTKVALTSDGWTNINNTSFFALTAHYLDHNNVLCSNLLECSEFPGQHSGHDIAEWIRKVTEDFNITNKVVAIVTDVTSNMPSAAKELKLNHFPCFAHTLNVVVKKSIQTAIKATVEEVKRIVTFFEKSSAATKKLSEIQNHYDYPILKLKQDTFSSWNSTYDMMEMFCKNKIPLVSCLDSFEVKTSLQNNDWIVLEQTIKILQNFDCAIKIASSEKTVTLSHMGLFIKVLIKKTSDLLKEALEGSVRKLANLLIEGLTERFNPLFQNLIVNQGMLLDPRMKRHSFENEEERFEETYNCIIDAIIPYLNTNAHYRTTANSQTQASQNENDQYRKHLFGDFVSRIVVGEEAFDPHTKAKQELDEYIESGYVELGSDPLAWWKQNQSKFPTLYILVKSIFCIPATSVPCERVFSKAGQIYNEKRSRLDPKNLTALLFLQHNGF